MVFHALASFADGVENASSGAGASGRRRRKHSFGFWAFPPFSAGEDSTDRDRSPRPSLKALKLHSRRSFLHGTQKYNTIWPENPVFNPILRRYELRGQPARRQRRVGRGGGEERLQHKEEFHDHQHQLVCNCRYSMCITCRSWWSSTSVWLI